MQFAQVAHAAGESGKHFLPEGTHVVVLYVEDEKHLLEIEQLLRSKDIKFEGIREPDPPWNHQLMSIGVVPCLKSTVKQFFKKFSLVK